MSGKAASNYRMRPTMGRPGATHQKRQRVGRSVGLGRVIAREPADNNVDSIAKVTDDFPEAIPVIARELDVIDNYLGALLDAALEQNATKDDQSLGGQRQRSQRNKPQRKTDLGRNRARVPT
jgi:hypothetical protein